MSSSSGPERLYVNLTCVVDSADNSLPQCQFSESRATPLLPAPASDYTMSLVRWQATGLALPLWIAPAVVGQSDPTLTVFNIFLSFSPPGADVSFVTGGQVFWTQQGQAPVPAAPLTAQDLSTTYYYANSFQQLCNIVNLAFYNALETVWGDYINTFEPAITKPQPPSLVYSNGRFSMCLDASLAPLGLAVGFNQLLASILGFSTYQAIWVDSDNSSQYLANVLDYSTLGLTVIGTPGSSDGPTYFVIPEENTSRIDGLCPIDTIVFTSSTMAVQAEIQANPVALGADDGPVLNTTQSNTIVSITDFSEPLSGGPYDWQGKVTYSPTFLRKLQMTSSQPLQNMDFQMWWRCRFNDQLYPVLMGPGSSVSLKCYFERNY